MIKLKKYLFILIGIIVSIFFFSDILTINHSNKQTRFDPNEKNFYGFYIFNQEIDNYFTNPVKRISTYDLDSLPDIPCNIISFNHIFKKDLSERLKKGDYFLNIEYEFYNNDSLYTIKTLQNLSSSKKDYLTAKNLNNITIENKEDNLSYILPSYYPIQGLGYFEQDGQKYINFAEISVKKGKVFRLLNRYPFTNANLKNNPQMRNYAFSVLAYLPADRPTFWLDLNFRDTPKTHLQEDMLSFIATQRPLIWAWRILLIGFILYIFFQGKRHQRIIPIIEKTQNSSIKFIQALAHLHYQNHNIDILIQKKINYFLNIIRQKYFIPTDTLDNNFIDLLTQKTGCSYFIIKSIIDFINHFNKTKTASEKDLIYITELIDQVLYTKS